MGKIRVKTIGDEEQSKKEQKKAEARAEAKRHAEEAKARAEGPKEEVVESREPRAENGEPKAEQAKEEITPDKAEKIAKKKEKFQKETKLSHGTKYQAAVAKLNRDKKYKLAEALAILPTVQLTKFDETVELHINTNEKGISGNVVLPHGTGKTTRVAIANQTTDPEGVEALVATIAGGQINFDVLIATPDAMPKLARVAKTLGPRGLMPNPKNGTVTPKPEEAAKKFQGGQMNFKTESKFPIMHLIVGKVSFGEEKLAANIKAAIGAIHKKNIKDITLKSTMSPGIKIEA